MSWISTYTYFRISVRIGTASVFEDMLNHVVEVVVGVRVIVSFGEPVDKDTWIRFLDLDLRVCSIPVLYRKEDIS